MPIRRSYSAPAKSAAPTTFAGKYSLKNKAGLDAVNKDAYVIALDMASGYVELPYHTLKKCVDGTGFKNSQFGARIACHKFDKNTGEIIDQLPLCCRLAQMEKDRLPDKEKSGHRAISFTAKRNVIPVMVLSTTETDTAKKPSLRKVSIKNGIDFSFIDISSASYDEFTKDVQSTMETEGIIECADDMDPEELAGEIAKYLQGSIIKISNITARNKGIPYEKSFKAIPLTNGMVAKESGEGKLLTYVSQVVNGTFPQNKLSALFDKYPEIQTINNQVIDFLELFNSEVDNLVSDWTDEELQSYYNTFLEKQGVVNQYKSDKSEETVSFTSNKSSVASVDEDDEFADVAPAKAQTATATAEKSEDEFDYATSDLEESSILEDEDFAEDDFEIEDGEEL
jgi:hypothetical protein